MNRRNKVISRYSGYYLLRKWTTPVHWAFGLMCATAILRFWPIAIILMIGFALFERWNDDCNLTSEGAMDWWESFFTFCIGFTVIIILNLVGIINVPWWGW